MNRLVTIGIPVYKRLSTLSEALQSVATQDYPHLELIVSDNGLNGTKVLDIVKEWYPRPYTFRQNSSSVPIAVHYNQLIEAATGEYFLSLDDDDTISPNFVSELLSRFERNPDVSLAIARQDIVDQAGRVLRSSCDQLPELVAGEEFIRTWSAYRFENYSTVLARTSDIRDCGGIPDFPGGTHIDDALVTKLCLKGAVAFSNGCTFRLRYQESSFGWSLKCRVLAEDTRRFLKFLHSDPAICAYAKQEPARWEELKRCLIVMTWSTYLDRWANVYQQRLSTLEWIKAGFAMPFIPEYYGRVYWVLKETAKDLTLSRAKKTFPRAYRVYKTLKHGAAECEDPPRC